MPFKFRSEPLGVAHCNKVGVLVPGRAELKAAIYQDGTSFGEGRWVDSILDSRRFQLAQIETVLNRLKARRADGLSGQVLTKDLNAELEALRAKNILPFPPVLDVRELAVNRLAGPESSLADQVARTVGVFERLRNQLLDASPPLR
jgi:hypothetical protein